MHHVPRHSTGGARDTRAPRNAFLCYDKVMAAGGVGRRRSGKAFGGSLQRNFMPPLGRLLHTRCFWLRWVAVSR
jgi:hypothetical protein